MHNEPARAELPTLLPKPVKLLEKAAEGRQPRLMAPRAFNRGQGRHFSSWNPSKQAAAWITWYFYTPVPLTVHLFKCDGLLSSTRNLFPSFWAVKVGYVSLLRTHGSIHSWALWLSSRAESWTTKPPRK